MSKGNEKYEFDYKNGFTVYHFVNGRRTEAMEFSTLQSPMDVINKRSEAKIREYEFDSQGKLYKVKYLSKFGNFYLPFYIGSEGKEEIANTSIYKKGTGWIDDVVYEASLVSKSTMFDILFSSDVYDIYQIDKIEAPEIGLFTTLTYENIEDYIGLMTNLTEGYVVVYGIGVVK